MSLEEADERPDVGAGAAGRFALDAPRGSRHAWNSSNNLNLGIFEELWQEKSEGEARGG